MDELFEMIKDMKNVVRQNTKYGGEQIIVRFDNGYGASIISHGYGREMGLKELAVLKFNGNKSELTYDTPITDDVIGYLENDEVVKILKDIEALEAK